MKTSIKVKTFQLKETVKMRIKLSTNIALFSMKRCYCDNASKHTISKFNFLHCMCTTAIIICMYFKVKYSKPR